MDKERYLEQLSRQLYFLKSSCDAYDAGHDEEALRIATTIRVLFHNRGRSVSLFTHLNLHNIKLLNSCRPYNYGAEKIAAELGVPVEAIKEVQYDPMIRWLLSSEGVKQVPKLTNTQWREQVNFEKWWNAQYVLMFSEHWFTRQDLVLLAANKDGGAHIDKDIPDELKEMMRGLWQGGLEGQVQHLSNYHFPCLRQMGYELLESEDLMKLKTKQQSEA